MTGCVTRLGRVSAAAHRRGAERGRERKERTHIAVAHALDERLAVELAVAALGDARAVPPLAEERAEDVGGLVVDKAKHLVAHGRVQAQHLAPLALVVRRLVAPDVDRERAVEGVHGALVLGLHGDELLGGDGRAVGVLGRRRRRGDDLGDAVEHEAEGEDVAEADGRLVDDDVVVVRDGRRRLGLDDLELAVVLGEVEDLVVGAALALGRARAVRGVRSGASAAGEVARGYAGVGGRRDDGDAAEGGRRGRGRGGRGDGRVRRVGEAGRAGDGLCELLLGRR